MLVLAMRTRGESGRKQLNYAAVEQTRLLKCTFDPHHAFVVISPVHLQGGGLYLGATSSATITSSTISGNSYVSDVAILGMSEVKWLTRLALGPKTCGCLRFWCQTLVW